jgi:hypothetical protein
MSRSNNEELVSPVQRFFEWDGVNGCFEYFDKTKKTETTKGEKVSMPLPFRFLVLDKLSTIKGYSKDEKSGYWSNEVRDIKKDVMVVRTKKGVAAKGTYDQVIDSKDTRGSKYCQSVYIAYKEGKDLVICNLGLTGSAVSSWIEFSKANKIMDGAIAVESATDEVNGATKYKKPVFKKIATTPESEAKAKELDVELQEYLAKYFKKTQQQIADTHIVEHVVTESKPVEREERKAVQTSAPVMDGSDDDLPF